MNRIVLRILLIFFTATLLLSGPNALSGQDLSNVRMLSNPAVSAAHVAFVYDGDLWLAERSGLNAYRLTTHPGSEFNPRFSPDGLWIAFTGEYDGNPDVYVVSVNGGSPQRLTWHPGADAVQDWTPDGRSVLFLSQRQVFTSRHSQLFTVGINGGYPDRLPVPTAFRATFSPDGSRIAYTPLAEPMNQWKNYRGGRASRIWLYDRDDHDVVQVILQVVLDLLLVLDPGHLRHVDGRFLSHAHDLVLEIGVDDLAILLVEEGRQPTQA